ncbi:MAG: fatty acid desaturase [Kiloniellaceae bacterium]
MDEEFAPEGALDKQALKDLSRRSDAKGLAQLAGHGAALAATGLLVAQTVGSVWLGPALVAHAVVLVFLFAPLHETIHRTAFASRRLSDAAAWVCGAALLLPPEFFRAFHFAHHRHTQDPARDPELAAAKPDSLGLYLWHVSGLPYWRDRAAALARHASGRVEEPFIAPRMRPAIVREARILLLFYAALAVASALSGSWAALWYWAAPALLGQPFLRMYLLAEHTGCPLVQHMLENSRTTHTNALVRRLAWNMPYHAEHHAYPALPFHALPAAHALLKDRIAVQAPGYLAVQRQILAGLGRRRPAAARR